jgi:phage head maturation protease
MTDHAALRAEAAKARAAATGSQRSALPCGEGKRDQVKFASQFRAEKVERDGQDFYLLEGYASMTEKTYEMWDFFGPYDETVAKDAFDETLAADPMVVYRFNHSGTPMASTRNKRLELWADSMGLGDRAWLNPQRDDVQLLAHAVDDQDVTEQSFMFEIVEGSWNDDMTEFAIGKVNLDRGDVGPVTYGANPHTIVATRSGELLAAIPDLPPLVAREAYVLLGQRRDIIPPAPAPTVTYVPPPLFLPPTQEPPAQQRGTSIRLALAQLEVDKQHQ